MMFGDMVIIQWSVTTPDGKEIHARIGIDSSRAQEMDPGRPPMDFTGFDGIEYRRRVDRAEAMAKYIAAQLAGDILKACDPDYRRKLEAKAR